MAQKVQSNSLFSLLFIPRLCIVALFLLLSTNVYSDEFIVSSFKQIDNKILTNDQKVYDDNDELCAIIMVRTSLIDLGISASTPIVGSSERIDGDIRVHLSAGTRMIKFFKDGFSTLEYVIPQRIENGTFYTLKLEYRRTDVAAAGNTMGFVVINSQPDGAEVYINGEATGLQTPFQNPYNEGYYSYTLKKSFYDDFKGDFTIKPGETTQKNIELIEDFGSLNISFKPITDVSVSIDGKISTQISPYFIEKLSPGKHNIVLNKATYDESSETFTITKGNTTNLNIEMLANFGSLTINTSPEINASISIDGIEYNNKTPFILDKLAPGNHVLSLSKSMYFTHKEEFIIEKGRSKTLSITMKPNFGNINITAKTGDEIFIDKQKVGVSTYSGRLLKGLHIIEVKRNNYITQSRQIDIIAGLNHDEVFELIPKTGILQIMTTPIGADIFLNNELQGQSPKFINNLLIGTYSFKLQKQGFATYSKSITIIEGETESINTKLSSAKQVTKNSKPQGAKLFVDDLNNIEHDFNVIKVIAVGQYQNLNNPDSNCIETALLIDFHFDRKALSMISDSLGLAQLANINSSESCLPLYLQKKVGNAMGNELISELSLNNQLRTLPQELNHTIFFTDLKLIWNDSLQLYISQGPIGIGYMAGKPINKYVNGFVQIEKNKKKSEISFFLSLNKAQWYFFSYKNGIMQVISSDSAFNDNIAKLKPSKRILNQDSDENYYEFVLSTRRKKVHYTRKMENLNRLMH